MLTSLTFIDVHDYLHICWFGCHWLGGGSSIKQESGHKLALHCSPKVDFALLILAGWEGCFREMIAGTVQTDGYCGVGVCVYVLQTGLVLTVWTDAKPLGVEKAMHPLATNLV